jgi:hypothetical protein
MKQHEIANRVIAEIMKLKKCSRYLAIKVFQASTYQYPAGVLPEHMASSMVGSYEANKS